MSEPNRIRKASQISGDKSDHRRYECPNCNNIYYWNWKEDYHKKKFKCNKCKRYFKT